MRLTSILFCVVHHEAVGRCHPSLMFLATKFNVTCNLCLSFLQLREGPTCMHILVFMLHGMHLAFHLLTHVAKKTNSFLLIARMCEERSGRTIACYQPPCPSSFHYVCMREEKLLSTTSRAKANYSEHGHFDL